jgi:hypothetical protein
MFIQVPYEDALPGDIGLLAGVGLISDAIRAAEQVGGELTDLAFQPSHAFIFAQDAILEAVYPRVALRPRNEYAGLSTRVFRASDSMPEIPVDVALSRIERGWLGRPYDVIGAIGIKRSMSLVELEEALGDQRLSNVIASGQSAWCSELASDFIDTYLAPVPPLVGSVTSPAKLYNWLRAAK